MNHENVNSNPEKKDEEKKKKKGIFVFFAIMGIALIIWGAVQTGTYFYSQYKAKLEQQKINNIVETTQAYDNSSAVNPIDFKSLQKKNDEIYAWIKIPGTPIDYPVVQSKVDDLFYLNHSATDKSYLSSGAIYTESLNTKTFQDRVTVIYGHNGYTDIMFMPLHDFEKENFFDEHDVFYIYTPDSKLTYKIVSAFKFDNRHLLNNFDFQNDEVFEEFLETIQNPKSNLKNVRKNLDKDLTIEDNIVVLSTCVWKQDSNRYLVCGVLVNDEKTD